MSREIPKSEGRIPESSPNDEFRMPKEFNHTKESGARSVGGRPYDLIERTALFGEAIIRFAKTIPVTPVTQRLIPQFVAAGTAIGSNYCEADEAESKKDFRHKIGLCRKESKETKYWIRMIAAAVPELAGEARPLWQEAKELNLIFGKIRRSTE